MLNDKEFKVKVDEKYVNGQIQDFKDKLKIIKSSESDWRNGVQEVASILARLESRLKYKNHIAFFDSYAYTTTTKINELIKAHSYLKIGEVEQFIADMPNEATVEMKKYTEETIKLCDKKPLFYIIANKKDFKNAETRRDPILLAQSPFGHFWQILGAWDEEMLFLEDL